MSALADVLIVTATDLEYEVAREVFEQVAPLPRPKPINGRLYQKLGTFEGTQVWLTLSEVGAGGVGGAQETIRKGIEALGPQAVILLGIGFGLRPESQKIGEVMLAEQLVCYELSGVHTTSAGQLQVRLWGDRAHASAWLLNHFRVAKASWKKAKVLQGCVLSGEKLIDNIEFRNQLQHLVPGAIGGEMEGAGLYAASHEKKVDWILLKAICDWADGQKETNREENQRLAARNATEFLLHALQPA